MSSLWSVYSILGDEEFAYYTTLVVVSSLCNSAYFLLVKNTSTISKYLTDRDLMQLSLYVMSHINCYMKRAHCTLFTYSE